MHTLIGSYWTKRLVVVMALVMALVGMVPPVDAGFITSEQSLPPEMRAKDLATVQRTLENKLVAGQLVAMGYQREEIDNRLQQISDEELNTLAMNLESLQPAADAGAVIAVLVIIVLVLLILHLVGKRVVVS